jgi:hypothetical protein
MRIVPRTHGKRLYQPPGLALVVVVSLVALLTLLAVALLSLVTSSRQTNLLEAESRKSELLAEAAFHTVLADLADEMEKGSTKVEVHKLEDGTTYRQYDLTTSRGGMRVTPALRDEAPATGALIKQSQPSKAFHTWTGAQSPRASALASAPDPLPATLWNLPRFLAPGETFTDATAPTWIYVTRDGSNPLAYSAELGQKEPGGVVNPKFVIGRYAYNLYDTSGLLDINAAGHPDDQPGAERVGSKGSLVMADLTRLPGMNAAAVAKLAAWKHEWSASSEESTEKYLRLSEGSGWRRMVANDNVFLSRQDLLDFAKKQPAAMPQEALPFLTHFSRDLNAPTHRPDPARRKIARNAASGGNDAYGADKLVNPDLTAYDEKRQRQLLPRRFPLERLKWVATPTDNGPIDPDKAKRYFGLTWQGTHWKYVNGRANGDLYTLQDVPSNREADFFEILRATVLAGSLGRQFAAKGWDDLDQRLSMHQLGGVDASVNLNIMELGACIIDQYDADSYPTGIMLPGPVRPYYAFGKEDVPYMCRTSAIPYRGRVLPDVKVYYADGSVAPTEAYEASMVLQPMLWRLHQAVKNFEGPTKFRFYPQHVDQGGGSEFWLTQGWTVPGKGAPPGWGQNDRGSAGDYAYWGGPNYRTSNPELYPKTFRGNEFIELTVPKDSTAFREPQSVHSPEHGQIAGYTLGGNVKPIEVRPGDLRWAGLPNSFSKVSGFLVGHAVSARIENNQNASSWNRLGVGYFRGDPIEVVLQYQAPDGTWRPYQRGEFTYKSNWGDHFLCKDPDWQTECFCWSSYLIDPRTARFGGLATVLASGVKTTQWTSLHPLMTWPEGAALAFDKSRAKGVRPGWTAPAPNTGWNFSQGLNWYDPYNPAGVAENNALAWGEPLSFCYKDPDEVMRPGVAAVNEYSRSIFVGNPMATRYKLSSTGKLTKGDSIAGRPVILNHEFRTVAELAYSFRGTPWRDIDFLSATSPDAGLLDVFCLYEDPDEEKLTVDEVRKRPAQVVAGRVNLNAAGREVIAALISGTARDEGNYISAEDAPTLAQMLVNSIRSEATKAGPILSKSELVSRPSTGSTAATSLITAISDKFAKPEDRSINDRREAVARALSDGTTVRSWNFTLDLVAQSGQFAATATSLKEFQASAERHFWVHFAVDRITGRLLDVQWEVVKQ